MVSKNVLHDLHAKEIKGVYPIFGDVPISRNQSVQSTIFRCRTLALAYLQEDLRGPGVFQSLHTRSEAHSVGNVVHPVVHLLLGWVPFLWWINMGMDSKPAHKIYNSALAKLQSMYNSICSFGWIHHLGS